MTYFFLGGPMDGEWKDIEEKHHGVNAVSFGGDVYNKQNLWGTIFFVHETIAWADIIPMLIECYEVQYENEDIPDHIEIHIEEPTGLN